MLPDGAKASIATLEISSLVSQKARNKIKEMAQQ